MNMLEDLPAGPQLRPERAEADKVVMSVAVRESSARRGRLPEGVGFGALWTKPSGHRRIAVISMMTAAVLALVVGLVVTSSTQPSGRPQGPIAQPGDQPGSTSGWRLVSDVSPSWRALPSSGAVPGEPKGLSFSCPTATTCYAANFSSKGSGISSGVEVTNDSGATWRALTLPVNLMRPPSLACVDADACAILGIDTTGNSAFLETTDGGLTWSSHAGPSALSAVTEPVQLACTSATSCLAVAAGPNSKVPPGSAVTFIGAASFMTDDSGNTWSSSSLPVGFIPSDLQCTSPRNCVSTGSISLGGPPLPVRATIVHTANDGTTWTAATLPAGLEAQSTYVPSTVSCAGTGSCLAIFTYVTDPSNEVLNSTDGGATWAARNATGLQDVGTVMGLSCASATDCWVAGVASGKGASVADAGVAASTTDGGATWQDAQLPQGIGAIAALSCPSELSCYALALQQANGGSDVPQPFVLLAYANPTSTRG